MEYAEKYAKKHHITVEEAKEHIMVKEYEAEHRRENQAEKKTNASSQFPIL